MTASPNRSPTAPLAEVSEMRELTRGWAVDGWALEMTAAELDGRVVITRLHLDPLDEDDVPEEGITARGVRRILVGERTRTILEELRMDPSSFFGEDALARTGRRHSSAESDSDDQYAHVALAYLWALHSGSLHPVVDLVERWTRKGHRIRVGTMKSWVHRARERGFLTQGTPGRAGADPTDKLRDWVAAHGEDFVASGDE